MQNVKVTRKGKAGQAPARLFLLFARKANVAVIFRRGPSKWVQLIKWNTDRDTFEFGQWLHGRIYERRCDLCEDGSLLIYFAQKINARSIEDTEYTYAWTAISKPPYLTALALWPKGDCWHGGGLFTGKKTVVLNHREDATKPHPDHKPVGLCITLKKNVQGEDDPLFSERLERDGWKVKQEWLVEQQGFYFKTLQPEIREKRSKQEKIGLRLIRSIEQLDYSEEFEIIPADKREVIKMKEPAGPILIKKDD